MKPRTHGSRVALVALGSAAPAIVASMVLLARADVGPEARLLFGVAILGAWLVGAAIVRARVERPFAVLSDVIASFREGDFSLRARPRASGAVGDAAAELNALGDELRKKRLEAMEATALLEKVIGEIDVAVLALDDRARLRLSNRAADRVLDAGGRASLSALLEGEAPRTLAFPEGGATWELRRSPFRLEGKPHVLVALTPLDRALREGEREAWRRLVRVLGHEINNALAPIQSIARSSLDLVRRAANADADLERGLGVIATRADALSRFSKAFSELGRLPPPALASVSVAAWAERARVAEPRVAVAIEPGPPCFARGDGDQLDQLLTNLVKNAADAVALVAPGAVAITWRVDAGDVELVVRDEGPGLASTENLFVPFYTTKPEGTGLGLVIARQIAEAHGGRVTLRNAALAGGCEAIVRLPRAFEHANKPPPEADEPRPEPDKRLAQ